MKIIKNQDHNASVVLSTLNGKIDKHGNLSTNVVLDGWSLISEDAGVSHYMKINRYNSQMAKHRFVNNTGNEVTYKWSINIITNLGRNLKYDFGTLQMKAGTTSFKVSVPYKPSRTLADREIIRIMVALMVI